MFKFNWWMRAYALFLLCAAAAITLPAQTFTTLHSFDSADGALPLGALVQATDGNLYGTTFSGGANSFYGTVFKITPNGALTTVHSFDFTDGSDPVAALIQAIDGNFYGTTSNGGANGSGTVFKITRSGTLTTLYSFCSQRGCPDGTNPGATLIQAADGAFYGTTLQGGANGYGTVFKITPSGMLTTLHTFDLTDGSQPNGLIQATDGNLFGTTYAGGVSDDGTVFKITPTGTLATLHSFDLTDGQYLPAGLVQASDGNFYGTTYGGGANGDGTVFKITRSGTLTTLYSFCPQGGGCTDGSSPYAGLVQATDGNLYGTTFYGGTGGYGTAFKITLSGTLTTLHGFDSTDGNPQASLVQATNGNFYGTTSSGGANGDGTVFRLSVGLGPFVETQPTSGRVGAAVKILGTNLTGATSVTFNGAAATFTVVSPSLITTTVPAGATTGRVKVTTPNGTLLSDVPFRVTAD